MKMMLLPLLGLLCLAGTARCASRHRGVPRCTGRVYFTRSDCVIMSAKARRAIVNGPIFTGTQVLHGHAVILKSMHSNMLKTYKTAYELARHLHHAARVGFAETLAMYHATQALAPAFFSDCRGRLEPGTRADIAVLDYRPHTPIADDNVWGHLLYGAAEAPVHATIAGGELAYHADVCATIDAPATTAACQAAAAQLWQRMASVQELSN